MRIAMRVVVEMTDEQVAALAAKYGLGVDGKVSASELRMWVKGYVRQQVRHTPEAKFWKATVS